jgi:hypothetical protein
MSVSTLQLDVSAHTQVSSATPGVVKAVSYLQALDQFEVLAAENALPANHILFFQRLRLQLETALSHVKRPTICGSEGGEDFKSYLELDWLCNQCEYWMGSVGQIDLSRICQKHDEAARPSAAMTAREYLAVRLLLHSVILFNRVTHNPLTLFPHPIRLCKQVWARSRDYFSDLLFALRQASRHFILCSKVIVFRYK